MSAPTDRSDCRHQQGWGWRWTRARYCLGCGLPLTVIAERAYETLRCVLQAAGGDVETQEKLDAVARRAGVAVVDQDGTA